MAAQALEGLRGHVGQRKLLLGNPARERLNVLIAVANDPALRASVPEPEREVGLEADDEIGVVREAEREAPVLCHDYLTV